MTISSSLRRVQRGVLVRGAGVVTAGVLMAGLISPALAGGSTTKSYTAGASPASISAGSTVAASFSIINQANPQTLGSAEITPPSGLTVGSPSLSGAGAASLSGGNIELRNLNLAPGATATVSFSLTAPCGSSGGSWTSLVKQSNNFNGPPGNNFTNSGTDPSTAVTGSCHLAFVNEPADATTSTVITSVVGDPSGAPVTVAAYAGDDSAIDGVSIGLSATPAVTVAGSTATTGPAGAAASFAGLHIATAGVYTLTATAAGFTSDTSGSFTIYDAGAFTSCPPGSTSAICNVSDTGAGDLSNTSGTASSSGGPNGGFLAMRISGNSATTACTGYTPTSGAVIDLQNTTGQATIATITLKRALSGNTGVSSFQVCFQPSPGFTFVDRSGNLVDSNGWGLLPDCRSPNDVSNAPCVVSRNRSPQSRSDVLITIAIPAGDPPRYFS